MKKISLIVSVCLFLTFAVNAQSTDTTAQAKILAEINKSNSQVIALFKEKKYDEALKVALEIQKTIDDKGLSKDLRVMSALSNLGEVYLTKKKESEAIAVFQKILDAYQANSVGAKLPAAKITERIATAYYYKKDYDKSAEYFLKALPLREKLNGAESKETVTIYDSLGNLYREKNQNGKAQEYYLKAIEINDKILSKEEKENREDVSNYECFLYHKALKEDKIKEVSDQIADFHKLRNLPESNIVNSGIVNGKALNLVKPPFPLNMRGVEGFVLVGVTIDESGNIISAKATCGILGFVEAVEAAARKSKFSPTLLNGQPVKVVGVIVYSFVRK
jgi:tetratricopeptide (TPR) repeat protein